MASTKADLSSASWFKSSYSNGDGGDCVEMANGLPDLVPVRDSKVQEGPVLLFRASSWAAFVQQVKG
ncbi:DUF397 domain-containing protein [Streptomyces sp. NPDC050516]|uniref:DUF397 domain-containing protein n=1 Tax=Streptomyces sp. NPDC050516 TaxID=3365621 RepID=UPI0037AFA229